jgi:hypothetical protein
MSIYAIIVNERGLLAKVERIKLPSFPKIGEIVQLEQRGRSCTKAK